MSSRRGRNSTRPIPGDQLLTWREEFLRGLRRVLPTEAGLSGKSPEGLEPGNKKTGRTGTEFRTVFVWNLPAVATCPAASAWCLRHCYNADLRTEVFPLEAWTNNWGWFEHEPDTLRECILAQLRGAESPAAVRLHSSGDFFSVPYIEFWTDVVSASPRVSFWAYTRSWSEPSLLPALEVLRAQPNMQLFASWDETIDLLPES